MKRVVLVAIVAFTFLLARSPADVLAQHSIPGLRQPTQILAHDERLLTIATRPGVTVRVLVTLPRGGSIGTILLFPGGEGFLVSAGGGYSTMYGAFRREFSRNGFTVAVVDAPSDQPHGMEEGGKHDRFRIDPRHAEDGRLVIDRLTRDISGPIYLFGHSMGAISVAYIAAILDDARIRAVILASSPTQRGGPNSNWTSVPSAPLNQIKIPVLLLHHWRDGCRGSTYEGARDYPRLFTASPRVSFVEVLGGDPPESTNPCVGNNYHSFFGVRAEVIAGIVRWLNGENVTRVGR